MTDHGDDLALRIVAEAQSPAERSALAAAFGEGDIIAQHLPISAASDLVRASWVQICALHAASHDDPAAHALRVAAIALLLDVAETMEPIITIPAPRDASTITDR